MKQQNLGPVSIVLLAHNEAEVIEGTVRGFHEAIVSRLPGSEIIVAEDGSTDGTKEILARLLKELPELRWEEGKERRGYVNAFKQAMHFPKNELILFCDCSGKHDPNDFWKFYPEMNTCDLVIGYKENRADPIYRVIMSRVFNGLMNFYFGVRFKDINCPFRLFKKSAFLAVSKEEWIEKALVNFELTLRFVYRGYKVKELPVAHFKRKNGESRGLPLSKIPRVILNLFKNLTLMKQAICHPEQRVTV